MRLTYFIQNSAGYYEPRLVPWAQNVFVGILFSTFTGAFVALGWLLHFLHHHR